MSEQSGTILRIGKRVAVILLLAAGTLFLASRPEPARAFDCIDTCDEQYSYCNACCSGTDCSACNNSCSGYTSCATACHPSGSCQNQTQCSNLYGRFYTQCMMNELSGECMNPDGSIDGACCNNEAVQEYFGCCYP